MEFKFASTMKSLMPMAKAFGIEIYEKDNSQGKGIVLAIGSGLMMATMDELKTSRYAIEMNKANIQNPYFQDFLALASVWSDYVCIHAWFSITKPEGVVPMFKVIDSKKVFWKSNISLGLGTGFLNFKDMSTHLNHERYVRQNIDTSSEERIFCENINWEEEKRIQGG